MDYYTEDNFAQTESIGLTLARARNVIASEMDAALRVLDITNQQMGILITMKRGAASTPYELSKLLGIDTGLMTRMLDKLEEKGLVQRSRSLEDRRVVNLTLTDKGQEYGLAIPRIAPPVLNARLRHFTSAEFDEFCRLLNKFVDA